MNGIVGTLRLGWHALLFRRDAYEEIKTSPNPAVRGLIFILIVALAIAVLNLIGTAIEAASTPSMTEIRETVLRSLTDMTWYEEVARADPDFDRQFRQYYDQGWQVFPRLFGRPDLGGAALGLLGTPLGLFIRWVLYGLLAYLFARWLGGTAGLNETLGVLALAAAPQMLNALNLIPYVTVGSLVNVWSLLCAFVGLRVAHGLSWQRAAWAALLPFILGLLLLVLGACVGSVALAALVQGVQ